METLWYVFLAIIALGVLIFVHEWGHYWMARRVGMKVEVFSIGFGKAIASWHHKGIRWQIGCLPLGGFVKITGMDVGDSEKGSIYDIEGGFFSKPPKDRLKVLLAGPLANLLLAFVFFSLIWACGGRDKPFADFTHKIGWIDPASQVYAYGVRPGDEIYAYDKKPFHGAEDLLYAAMLGESPVFLQGAREDYLTKEKTPFNLHVDTYPYPGMHNGLMTTGVLSMAKYLVYDRVNGKENLLPTGSPMEGKGLVYGDRIVWADGEIIFSQEQLSNLLNHRAALLTVDRQGHLLIARIPRIKIAELRLSDTQRGELEDWQYATGLSGRLETLSFLPYDITDDNIVQSPFNFIDQREQRTLLASPHQLLPGDKILAIDGIPTADAATLFSKMQGDAKRPVYIIVEKADPKSDTVSYQNADKQFDSSLDLAVIRSIAAYIGTQQAPPEHGRYHLLGPIIPKATKDFSRTQEEQEKVDTTILEERNKILSIEDPVERHQALVRLDAALNTLVLGIGNLQDRYIHYNPSPLTLFWQSCVSTGRTLGALVTGHLNAKWVSGPVGIVPIISHGWQAGGTEMLYWTGFISLNLGLLNLLPIPVLDGGYIAMTLWEIITKKKIPQKWMHWMAIPFVLAIIAFFLYVTYHDILRLFW